MLFPHNERPNFILTQYTHMQSVTYFNFYIYRLEHGKRKNCINKCNVENFTITDIFLLFGKLSHSEDVLIPLYLRMKGLNIADIKD
jgi:hypothetical protein